MVILRTQNKITDFFMILAWASPFKLAYVAAGFAQQNCLHNVIIIIIHGQPWRHVPFLSCEYRCN